MDFPRRFLSPEEFHQLTGLSLKTVHRRLHDGRLRAVQPGGPHTRWLIPIDALEPTAVGPDNHPDVNVDSRPGDSRPSVEPPEQDRIPLPGPRPRWMRRRAGAVS